MVQYVELASNGSWPQAGGTLDQSAQFLAAYELVMGQRAKYVEEMRQRGASN